MEKEFSFQYNKQQKGFLKENLKKINKTLKRNFKSMNQSRLIVLEKFYRAQHTLKSMWLKAQSK